MIRRSLYKINLNSIFRRYWLLIFCNSILCQPVFADEMDKTFSVDMRPELSSGRKNTDESKTIIEDIINKAPFVNVQEETVWNFKETDSDVDDDDPRINPDVSWLGDLIAFLSMVVEAVLWGIPVLIAFYLYRNREYWLSLLQGEMLKTSDDVLPDTLFGLDVNRDSLPDDIEQAALALWQNQKFREAVSLLYRGALVVLFEKYRFELPSGATEQDCLRYLEMQYKNTAENTEIKNAELRIERFKKITDVWITLAYAHRLPEDTVFNEICSGWNAIFFSQVKT